MYRRRDNGRRATVTRNNRQYVIDNRWIVPYNPYLIRRFGCHINVEICSSIIAVKYMYKYVYKGSDRIVVQQRRANNGDGVDEIQRYLDCRYVSASESTWRIFGFAMHKQTPNVVRLQVHLPGQQLAYFNPIVPLDHIVNAAPRETTLTQYFQANVDHQQARDLLYGDMPSQFVWNLTTRRWTLRLRLHANGAIGRMLTALPSEGERFYLRLLLCEIRGAVSFEALRTIAGVLYPTFREAALALGLLEDDNDWILCLEEAQTVNNGRQLRQLFAIILLFGPPATPELLFRRFQDSLSDDFVHNHPQLPPNAVEARTLHDINRHLQQHGRSLQHYPNMPIPDLALVNHDPQQIFLDEMAHAPAAADFNVEERLGDLNIEQQEVANQVILAANSNESHLFFLDAPGGTGKTFTFNTILDVVRHHGHIALPVATSGIAALLLKGGRTAHSRFKIPVTNINETSNCSIVAQSELAQLIRRTRIVVWDEASMANKYQVSTCHHCMSFIFNILIFFQVNCVNASFQDLCRDQRPFGGKVVLFGGDFRQVLPVVRHGERARIVAITLKRWNLWPTLRQFQLRENIRIRQHAIATGDDGNQHQEFADFLLRIGEGREPTIANDRHNDFIASTLKMS